MKESLKKFWLEWVRPFLLIALVLGSLRSALADWNDVPTGSMKPTILEGDRVFVNKMAYDLRFPFTLWRLAEWDNPKRGDIVVFFSPHDGKRLVKRVVGVPGDTLEMRVGRLHVNGVPAKYDAIDESVKQQYGLRDPDRYIFFKESVDDVVTHPILIAPDQLSVRNFGPVTVPAGKYFMMGDNRDESFDSRYFGFVERRQIVGHAISVVVSVDRDNWWLPRTGRFFDKLL
ncbi:MAG: signal peptidase I [Acidobacteria bacterium]|nr:signal peptidase I [Acidobacteriota bacterium]